jgi:hypothetical protein
MKTLLIVSAVLTGLLLFSAVVCGLWLRYAGSAIAESSPTFHMGMGLAAAVFSMVTAGLGIAAAGQKGK